MARGGRSNLLMNEGERALVVDVVAVSDGGLISRRYFAAPLEENIENAGTDLIE